ncbi:hypothetical protein [Bradyrhizobium diazoefficiens]
MSGRIAMAPIKSSWPIIVARLSLCLLVWGAMVPAALAADRNEPKRLLLLHSFGRDFRPWSEYARSIKAEFEQQSSFALDIQEHTLLSARFNSPGPEAPFVDYLRSLYRASPPDLVMSLGAPAARFVQKYREQLFPDTPLVMTAVEQRLVNRGALTQNDVVIPVRNDFTAFFGSILQVLPETRTVAVVIGASPLEKFWLDEVKREAKPFEDRFELIWYADLSFEEILKRASTLPPHTVLFWQLMSVDGVGVAHEGDLALRRLHAVANGPIFSYQEAFFGRETVGGPMHSISESSKETVSAALRIFAGEKPRRHQDRTDRICRAEIRLARDAALGHQRERFADGKRGSISRAGALGKISLANGNDRSSVPSPGRADQRATPRTSPAPSGGRRVAAAPGGARASQPLCGRRGDDDLHRARAEPAARLDPDQRRDGGAHAEERLAEPR